MASHTRFPIPGFLFVILFSHLVSVSCRESDNFIVHMDLSAMPKIYADHHGWYAATVQLALDSPSLTKTATKRGSIHTFNSNSKLIYSYTHAIQGFSAHLSRAELEAVKNTPGYVSSIRDLPVKPDTTHSSQFLGLTADSGAWPISGYGKDVIVGVVDTGVWPESQSFKDDGMEGIPSRWKGECSMGTQFNSSMCNKKLIGARYFNKGLTAKNPNLTISMNSARDTEGHGTHTSSTAAGNYVEGVSFSGYAPGTARGMAPRARVAMYKALWAEGSYTSDIIAAIDQAISDGVDVLSLSLGLDVNALYLDPIAIATFAAVEKGIFVTTSAGNEGPFDGTLHNGTPWVITVAAGDMDRDFGGVVTLGDGVQVSGSSLFPGDPHLPKTPILLMQFCNDSAALNQVGSKIVVCDDPDGNLFSDQVDNVQIANVSGGIFITKNSDIEFYIETQFPAVFVTPKSGEIVKEYIRKAEAAAEAGMEFGKTIIGGGGRAAPRVASYSSRGPSPSCPHVLKPDILAPGSLILAAWPENSPAAFVGSKSIFSKFNLLSGTSMSCPHVAGVAALIRGARPQWTPAAIRSAIMTTSYSSDNTLNPIQDIGKGNQPASPLAIGSGHVDPNKALDPGLVYDSTTEDYTNLLCALNYTAKQIQTITRSTSVKCSNPSMDLNYPSFIALLDPGSAHMAREFNRTVTNMGDGPSSYSFTVTGMKGFKVAVEPDKLVFKEKYEKLSYKLTVEGPVTEPVAWGHLSWTDGEGKYVVRSPIVATTLPSS